MHAQLPIFLLKLMIRIRIYFNYFPTSIKKYDIGSLTNFPSFSLRVHHMQSWMVFPLCHSHDITFHSQLVKLLYFEMQTNTVKPLKKKHIVSFLYLTYMKWKLKCYFSICIPWNILKQLNR